MRFSSTILIGAVTTLVSAAAIDKRGPGDKPLPGISVKKAPAPDANRHAAPVSAPIAQPPVAPAPVPSPAPAPAPALASASAASASEPERVILSDSEGMMYYSDGMWDKMKGLPKKTFNLADATEREKSRYYNKGYDGGPGEEYWDVW